MCIGRRFSKFVPLHEHSGSEASIINRAQEDSILVNSRWVYCEMVLNIPRGLERACKHVLTDPTKKSLI